MAYLPSQFWMSSR
uniref:Uncharacterized protein n=1 Tax=Anguilla anguilla TaxID=7936 RepID=A0A0E9TK86_ANGAN